MVRRAAAVDGEVKQPAIPLAGLPLRFTERKGSGSVERPKNPGTSQNARRSANAAITSEAAGDAAFGVRAFPKGGGSRTGVGPWLSGVAGRARGAAVYFGANKPTVLLACTTSILCSTAFPELKWEAGRRSSSLTSPTAEPIPDNLFSDPVAVRHERRTLACQGRGWIS
jgi:hypothetical protein